MGFRHCWEAIRSRLRKSAPSASPFVSASEQPVNAPDKPSGLPSQLHVLYIDDVEIVALMVESLLTRANYRVSIAKTPEAGLALFHAAPHEFHVLVTDYSMPRSSGLEVIAEVRKVRPELPTVLTSGHVTDDLRRQAKEAGVAAVVEKQTSFDGLGTSLERAIETAVAR